MEPIRLPNGKEINTAYEDGKEASRHRVTGLINLRHVVYENAVVKGVVDKKGMLDIS